MEAAKDCITIFDTDMHIHSLDTDVAVASNADSLFNNNKPNAISSFSLVELKGNYIQCLVLLQKKISRSSNLKDAYSRIRNTGGRKPFLMLTQLINTINEEKLDYTSWEHSRNFLLTILDSQIEVAWITFSTKTDCILDDLHCSRALEEPIEDEGKWSVAIPKCTSNNASCRINEFLHDRKDIIDYFINHYPSIENVRKTNELDKIYQALFHARKGDSFNWDKKICRSVGDLLIALQCVGYKSIISSNYREHSVLSELFSYAFIRFNIASIRRK